MFPKKLPLTAEVQIFVSGLLQRNPSVRFGAIGGIDDFRCIEFFSGTNWEKIYSKEEFPPFIPLLDPDDDFDTRNFDKEFTGLKAKESIAEDARKDTKRGSQPQSCDSVVDFIGFSFSCVS